MAAGGRSRPMVPEGISAAGMFRLGRNVLALAHRNVSAHPKGSVISIRSESLGTKKHLQARPSGHPQRAARAVHPTHSSRSHARERSPKRGPHARRPGPTLKWCTPAHRIHMLRCVPQAAARGSAVAPANPRTRPKEKHSQATRLPRAAKVEGAGASEKVWSRGAWLRNGPRG